MELLNIKKWQTDKDIKRHMYYAMSALIGGMFTIIIILFDKL